MLQTEQRYVQCIYEFESDKHSFNGLVDILIFSGRVIDDAVVNVHNSV